MGEDKGGGVVIAWIVGAVIAIIIIGLIVWFTGIFKDKGGNTLEGTFNKMDQMINDATTK